MFYELDSSFIQFSVQRYEFYVEQTQKEAWNMKCFTFFITSFQRLK